ncbi:MAG: GreA/GreB family elongation factor [Chloroflexi bacterium]|nr:GreA/GreB family elongation factor [Chloroflexota bacterium]
MEQTSTIGEAAAKFLAQLAPSERDKAHQEAYRFARWIGFSRRLDEIKPLDVARYGEQISATTNDPASVLEPVRSFLAYARKSGLTGTNLAVHLRVKKAAAFKALTRNKRVSRPAVEPVAMTAEGRAALESELRSLEGERPRVIEEIQKAAADKDFRENAPLQAAKERQGYLEGRIREVETTLKAAVVVNGVAGDRIGPGDYVVLKEEGCDDDLCLTVVHATEANASKAKISLVSPMGKALVGRRLGDTVEVAAPGGTVRYKIAAVDHKSG